LKIYSGSLGAASCRAEKGVKRAKNKEGVGRKEGRKK